MKEKSKTATIRTARLFLRPLEMSDAPTVVELMQDMEVLRYVNPHLKNRKPPTLASTTENLQTRLQENHLVFAILLLPPALQTPSLSASNPTIASLGSDPSHVQILAESEIVGTIGMRPGHHLGYFFARAHWGKGLATECLKAVLALIWRVQAEWERVGRDKGQEAPFGELPRGVPEGLPTKKGLSGRNGEVEREYVSASTDAANKASHRVLEKCGAVRNAVDAKHEDWEQTPEEREADGQKWNYTWAWRLYRP